MWAQEAHSFLQVDLKIFRFVSVPCPRAFLSFKRANGPDLMIIVNMRSKGENFSQVKNDLMKLQAVSKGHDHFPGFF